MQYTKGAKHLIKKWFYTQFEQKIVFSFNSVFTFSFLLIKKNGKMFIISFK